MSPRRSAFIDIGTNAVLCLIADLRDTGRFRVLDDLAEVAGLGRGVDQSGAISAAGEQRCLETLERYRDHCQNLGVDEIVAVGTSALRDARNSAEVRERLRARLGFEIRVISGDEEAAYSFLAVERGLSLIGELLVIDIGGGSTEFILGNSAGVTLAESVDIGSVRLTERFLHTDPVGADEIVSMNRAIDRQLMPLLARYGNWQTPPTLVGIAGTFTTLSSVEKQMARYVHAEVHGCRLSLAEVRRQIGLFSECTLAERQRIVGLEAKRADVILAGACLIERILILLGSDSVVVSDQGVRYGLLHERAQSL
ncbi:MAG: Ppx/GppA family phosphatase [Deltaproteobacteria bacterium]|nr:Ppx/GppA family phosphatase [Deltaproteobacteria bacterium]